MSTRPPATTGAATVPPPDLSCETDEDLLLMMSWSPDNQGTPDAVAARAAWGEFFVRHRAFLYHCCRGWGSEAADIVAETFRRVRLKAGQFPRDRLDGVTDPAARMNIVRAWLGLMARRVAIDLHRLRARAGEVLGPVELEERACGADARRDTVGASTEVVERVRQAVRDVLTDREREVVNATLQYYDVGLGRSAMPTEAVTELARRLGMTAASIRKTRERAYEKLRARLEPA
jgi:RNA polymerase sigma factor (sigma-70 family)